MSQRVVGSRAANRLGACLYQGPSVRRRGSAECHSKLRDLEVNVWAIPTVLANRRALILSISPDRPNHSTLPIVAKWLTVPRIEKLRLEILGDEFVKSGGERPVVRVVEGDRQQRDGAECGSLLCSEL